MSTGYNQLHKPCLTVHSNSEQTERRNFSCFHLRFSFMAGL